MMSALDCRRQADRCEKMACNETDRTNRRMLLAIADQWRGLATMADRPLYPLGEPRLYLLSRS